MSSDEEESCEYDERYGFWGEDGQWYDRRDNQSSKEDQIYGVFCQNSSKSNRSYNHIKKKKYKYNEPIMNAETSNLGFNFVKGGVQTCKDIKEEGKTDTNTTNNTSEQQSILKEWESVKKQKRDLLASRTGPELGKHGLPKQLGKQSKSKHKSNKSDKSEAIIGLKKDQGYASWTKTEKRDKFGGLSFAEKYLQKHGFKGRLGSKAQGIANPIKQAAKRKNNEGLGFNNIDRQKPQPKNVEQELEEIKKRTENEKTNIKQQQKMWKIIDENNNGYDDNDIQEFVQPLKKRKISYETASDFYWKRNNNDDVMEIYDYTREEVRITTSDKISDEKVLNDICPAFKHNIDKICDIIEEKKVILNRERENLKQKKYSIKLQLDTLTKQRSRDNVRGKKLYELKTLIDELKSKEITSDMMYDIFEKIQKKFYVEYLKYKLWRLFTSIVFGKIKEELKGWKLISNGCDMLIDMLVKWKRLLGNNYLENKKGKGKGKGKKDVYDLFIEEVIVSKIRNELYEWYPLERDVNNKFIELFKRLRDVFPNECYLRLINNLIISRLNHIFQERDDINDNGMSECIIGWRFVFEIENIDNILGKNICKKMKYFWRGFNGKNENEHRFYINVLKKWESVLLDVMDGKMMDNMYNVIIETIVLGKLKGILTDCVHKMEEKKKGCVIQFGFVHLWYELNVLNMKQYLKLIQNGFFDKWLFLLYERLKEFEENNVLEDIKFIWNDLFAVIKNDIFGKERDEKIRNLLQCDVIEKYLNCGLDMINWVISNDSNVLLPLPLFDIIKDILMNSMRSKIEKKKSKKKKKKKQDRKEKSEWINEYKNDINNALDNVMNDDIMKSIGIVQLIEMKAQNLGVEFYLDFNKQYDGKKVYKFGKLYICFYDKSIFAKQGNEWKPVDIHDLTTMC